MREGPNLHAQVPAGASHKWSQVQAALTCADLCQSPRAPCPPALSRNTPLPGDRPWQTPADSSPFQGLASLGQASASVQGLHWQTPAGQGAANTCEVSTVRLLLSGNTITAAWKFALPITGRLGSSSHSTASLGTRRGGGVVCIFQASNDLSAPSEDVVPPRKSNDVVPPRKSSPGCHKIPNQWGYNPTAAAGCHAIMQLTWLAAQHVVLTAAGCRPCRCP